MKTLVFGEILWDIIEGKPHLGGAPLNFAAHLKQCGQESAIISCLGKDKLGEEALKMIEDLHVDVSMIQRSEVQTGFVPVTLTNGQPDYVITPDVAYDYIEADRLNHSKIAGYDFFYFGSLIQRSPSSRKSLNEILNRHAFKEIFYDVNLRKDCYNQSIIEYSLKHCTLLKLNDEEVRVLSEMVFGEEQTFESFGQSITNTFPQIKNIVITAGARGCFVYHDNKLDHLPTEEIKVVDTVGAGDAFSAAFITNYIRTKDPLKAASIANKVGAFVASSKGAIPKYPSGLKLGSD